MTAKDLLHILDDLKDKEFERFKWHLKQEKVDGIPPIQESQLSKAERWNVVDLMLQKYEFAGAVKVFKNILKSNRNDLVRKLPNISSGAEEDGVSTEEAQIERQLHKATGQLIVVLQLGCKHEECNPLSRLRELTEHRCLMPTDTRPADQPQSYMSASHTHQMRTGVRSVTDIFTGKNQITTKKRPADPPLTEMETDNSPSLMSTDFVRYLIPGSRSSVKGNHSDNKVNLVLLGMAATGKSASGNTILGKKQFVSRASHMPVTTECQEAETVINGTRVCVIDTPDIFDDAIESSVKNQHVTKCKQLIQPGPCVYLLVIQISRFTDGERDILKKLEKAFGSRAKEQTVVLFTHGKALQRAKMSLESFLQDCQPELKNIVDQCDRRCVVFDNKAPYQHQVTELMQTVKEMLNK